MLTQSINVIACEIIVAPCCNDICRLCVCYSVMCDFYVGYKHYLTMMTYSMAEFSIVKVNKEILDWQSCFYYSTFLETRAHERCFVYFNVAFLVMFGCQATRYLDNPVLVLSAMVYVYVAVYINSPTDACSVM